MEIVNHPAAACKNGNEMRREYEKVVADARVTVRGAGDGTRVRQSSCVSPDVRGESPEWRMRFHCYVANNSFLLHHAS